MPKLEDLLSPQALLELKVFELKKEAQERAEANDLIPRPQTPQELKELTKKLTGIDIPDKKVCPKHSPPFEAFCAAYFAESPAVVWLASRGFGGKSVLLAALSMVEAVTLGCGVNLLGGSGEQSGRVHKYMIGEEPELSGRFWGWDGSPKQLLKSDHTKRETVLTNRGTIRVLMASGASVRGPHPARLRLDECDEMKYEIFEAALGQPMPLANVKDNIVCSSTHHHPDGTFTEILKMARKNHWPIFEWCYRECLGSWLTQEMVDRKKLVIPAAMWKTEYDLQEPSSQNRAILTESVEAMFRSELGTFKGDFRELIEIEEPCEDGYYITGADWAKKQDKTAIVTIRVDVTPCRLVAFQQMNRLPWPVMVKCFNDQSNKYPGDAIHDGTGLGTVVDDLLEVDATSMVMVGRARKDLFSNYIKAIENKELESPMIKYMYDEHRYCKVDDLYGSGHPPDTVVAMALAWYLSDSGYIP